MLIDPTVAQGAYEHCLKLARSRFENFPVASPLIPRAQRLALAAIYAFTRQASDYATLPAFEGQREELLQDWEDQLDNPPEGPVFTALADARERFRLPLEPLKDLARSYRRGPEQARYASFAQLREACRLSANPIGRLILRMFKKDSAQADQESDALCTALKLTGYLQNLAADLYERGRLTLPQDECGQFGVPEVDLLQRRYTPGLVKLIAFQAERARELFLAARRLPWRVKGRLGVELKLTMITGLAVLDKIEEQGFNPFIQRPKINDNDWLKLVLKALFLPVR